MGVSSTARLPSLGAQSIPPLFSHLQHTSNAKVVARWSITIRSFRAVPVPTNAWPSADQYDSSFTPTSINTKDTSESASANAASSSTSNFAGNVAGSSNAAGGSSSSASGAPPLTKPKTMWQVWLSNHPGVVFVIVEDTGRPSRAKAWRDWEVSTKKWKKSKRRELEALRKREEKARQAAENSNPAETEAVESTSADAGKSEDNTNDKVAAQSSTADTKEDNAVPMDVDAAVTQTAHDTSTVQTATPTGDQQVDTGIAPSTDQAAEPAKVEDAEQDVIETAGPKPKLRLPSHTRYTVSALTSSMSAMLTGLNLPPPHGAPAGTAGPGAWVPRGAAVSIEGLVLEINSQSLNALPGISPALASVSSIDDAPTVSRSNGTGSAGGNNSSGVDWRVRVGSVMGGGGRSAGAIVEAEFLPVSSLLPTSKFMHDFLHSLFPPGLLPMPPPAPALAPGMPNQNGLRIPGMASQAASANGTPRANNATLGPAGGMNGNGAAPGPSASGSGFSYTIGGGVGAGAAPPNRNFNIPIVSDQLWEEVVPRSGESWRNRIAKRSHQMRLAARQQRRQRKKVSVPQNEAKSSDAAREQNGTSDEFGWHTFGSDDEADPPANGDWQDENEDDLSSSDSEAEQVTVGTSTGATAGGLLGTAVTMQQADEDDDDDDDDRPLGAPIWSNANRNTAASNSANPLTSNPASNATAPDSGAAKKEDTVQLIFQGLRPDAHGDVESVGEADGWTGIERGRRIAFQYVQMLRAEGFI